MNGTPQQKLENSPSSLNQPEGIDLVDAYSVLIEAFMRMDTHSSSDPKSDSEDKEDDDGEEIQ